MFWIILIVFSLLIGYLVVLALQLSRLSHLKHKIYPYRSTVEKKLPRSRPYRGKRSKQK